MRRRDGPAFVFLIVTVLFAPLAYSEPIAVTTRPVALNPEDGNVKEVGALVYRGGLDLRSRDRRFGGLSALSVDSSGGRLLALTDKGYWIEFKVTYDVSGELSGVGEARIGALGGLSTASIAGTGLGDAESIARMADGYAIGFESQPRIWHYRQSDRLDFSKPLAIRPPRGLRAVPINKGIEALAALGDGRLLALSEGLRVGEQHVRGWVSVGRGWRPLRYRLTGRFVPTGAATLAGGDVLVLERRFTWVGGLASRIVRVPGEAIRGGATLSGREIAIIDPPLSVENFEGIAVRPRRGGGAFVYLVSDDNFFAIQRTLLMMFEYSG